MYKMSVITCVKGMLLHV